MIFRWYRLLNFELFSSLSEGDDALGIIHFFYGFLRKTVLHIFSMALFRPSVYLLTCLEFLFWTTKFTNPYVFLMICFRFALVSLVYNFDSAK